MMLSIARGIGATFGKSQAPFISSRYRQFSHHTQVTTQKFPYDVPNMSRSDVAELVNLSKPFCVSGNALQRLQNHVPQTVFDILLSLQDLRFFREEFYAELSLRLSPQELQSYSSLIFKACTVHCRLRTSLWTKERAAAYFQRENPLLRRASATGALWDYWQRMQQTQRRTPTEAELRYQWQVYCLGLNLMPPSWVQHAARNKKIAAEALWDQILQRQGLSRQSLIAQHQQLIRK